MLRIAQPPPCGHLLPMEGGRDTREAPSKMAAKPHHSPLNLQNLLNLLNLLNS